MFTSAEIHAPTVVTDISTRKTVAVSLSAATIIAIGVVCTSVLLVLTITIVILLIIYVRRKTKEIGVDLNQTDGSAESKKSPSSNRKGHASPKLNSSPRHSNGYNVHLDNYEMEPRRAGSPPTAADFDVSIKTVGSVSTSTFVESINKI